MRYAAAGLAAPLVGGTAHAQTALPGKGDRLVEEDAEGAPQPLRVSDLKPGRPMLAFPFDPKRGQVRNESRLNKVVLIKLAEADMNPATRERSAGGVIAFSAICTHQACDVKTWLAKDKALVCFCHSSKFQLLEGGIVSSGPATRSLPSLPLALDGEQLVVAGAFSAPPGAPAT
jgi:rieske iron-sulfur protein